MGRVYKAEGLRLKRVDALTFLASRVRTASRARRRDAVVAPRRALTSVPIRSCRKPRYLVSRARSEQDVARRSSPGAIVRDNALFIRDPVVSRIRRCCRHRAYLLQVAKTDGPDPPAESEGGCTEPDALGRYPPCGLDGIATARDQWCYSAPTGCLPNSPK